MNRLDEDIKTHQRSWKTHERRWLPQWKLAETWLWVSPLWMRSSTTLHGTKLNLMACRKKWQPTPVFLPGKSWTEEPGGLQSMGSQRVGHDWATKWQQQQESCYLSFPPSQLFSFYVVFVIMPICFPTKLWALGEQKLCFTQRSDFLKLYVNHWSFKHSAFF